MPVRRWMIAALCIRAAVLRVMTFFNRDPELRTRLEGTVAMRKAYRRGLAL